MKLEEVYMEMIDPVTYTFESGDSQWVLEVMPENVYRWNSNEKLYRLWGCGLLIVLLLTGFVFMIMLLHRTQESENTVVKLNKKLQKAFRRKQMLKNLIFCLICHMRSYECSYWYDVINKT